MKSVGGNIAGSKIKSNKKSQYLIKILNTGLYIYNFFKKAEVKSEA